SCFHSSTPCSRKFSPVAARMIGTSQPKPTSSRKPATRLMRDWSRSRRASRAACRSEASTGRKSDVTDIVLLLARAAPNGNAGRTRLASGPAGSVRDHLRAFDALRALQADRKAVDIGVGLAAVVGDLVDGVRHLRAEAVGLPG